ncbi:hypothetical protein [Aquipuribacter hungaricus]|uniref:Uncharacterized protein n=1 Tax=Aquipuribacter hungaricus TaxID=545624 RepID=A0ABV7WKT7_9MICO
MSSEHAGSSTRDGIALLMAAMRDDPVAVALLLEDWSARQTRDVAVFCAYLAAGHLKAAETQHSQPGLYDAALHDVALQLAATGRTTLTE